MNYFSIEIPVNRVYAVVNQVYGPGSCGPSVSLNCGRQPSDEHTGLEHRRVTRDLTGTVEPWMDGRDRHSANGGSRSSESGGANGGSVLDEVLHYGTQRTRQAHLKGLGGGSDNRITTPGGEVSPSSSRDV
jgi:hypothetical protein